MPVLDNSVKCSVQGKHRHDPVLGAMLWRGIKDFLIHLLDRAISLSSFNLSRTAHGMVTPQHEEMTELRISSYATPL